MTIQTLLRALSLAGLVVALPATAIPLPAPFAFGEAFFNFEVTRTTLTGFGGFDHSVPGIGTLQYQSTGTPLPALQATADVQPIGATAFGTVSGVLRYSFEIVGADGLVPVRIDANGHVRGLAETGAVFEATSRWSLRDTSENELIADSVSVFFDGVAGGGADDDAFAEQHFVMLQTNREYRVVMAAIAKAGTQTPGALGEAAAFIDPFFSFGAGIDPALYSFHFSDGIGNQPPAGAVPAPGSALLASAALLLAGGARGTRGATGTSGANGARRKRRFGAGNAAA